MSLADQLEELLAPLLASQLGVSAAEGPEQLAKIQDLLAAADDTDRADGFAWLANRMATLSPTAGSWVGVYLGGLVERGRLDAVVSAPGVLAFFRSAVGALADGSDIDEWHACAGLLGPSIVTQLSADSATLASLREDTTFLAAVAAQQDASEACLYVNGLARLESGTLTLLDPEARRGLLVNYENLGSCAHLITLLQSVLPRAWSEGRTQAPQMLAAAWGEHAVSDELPGDEAWFLYSHPATNAATAEAVDPHAVLSSIRLAGDQSVLVVWPSTDGTQTWPASAFAPQLSLTRPTLSIVRELEHSEVVLLAAQLPT